MDKILAVILSMSILTSAMPRPAVADGDRLDPVSQEREYSQREAECSSLEEFSGGVLGTVIAILVIVALVVLVWWLIDGHHHPHHLAYSSSEGHRQGCDCLALGNRSH